MLLSKLRISLTAPCGKVDRVLRSHFEDLGFVPVAAAYHQIARGNEDRGIPAMCAGIRAGTGGMTVPDAKHLQELEKENATLKRLLAGAELEKAALKVSAQGKW